MTTPQDDRTSSVNVETVDELRDDLEDAFGDFVELFLNQSPSRMATLSRAVDAGDAAEVKLVAHSLKSSAAYLGAEILAQLCGKLEAMGNGGELGEAREVLAAAIEEQARVAAFLVEYGARNGV